MLKKTFLFATAVLAVTSLFTSCKKKDDSNNTDQLATLGKATITGHVYARLVDTIGASGTQVAPTNTMISAWVDTRDFVLNPAANTNYPKRYYTATVDANGNYKLVVDVSKYQAANVTIAPQQFSYAQTKNTIGVVHRDSVYTVQKVYDPNPAQMIVPVYNDLTAIRDISYE